VHSLAGTSASSLQLPLTQRLLDAGKAAQSGSVAAGQGGSFQNLMTDGVLQVNAMQQDATGQINELLTGGDVNQAEVYTAVQKADMAFRMLVQVRNKLMAAYEELNNIRI
jgi:flagellar hook-basal body complex protein FliE